jgi:F-type H+-transporting ATPase subunit b
MLSWINSMWDSFIGWLVPSVYASEGGHAVASGPNANPLLLGIDLRTLLMVILNLILLIWLLRRFLYKPVTNMIAERKASAGKIIDEAKEYADSAKTKLEETEKERDKAIEDARATRTEAIKTAEAIHEDIVNKAQSEAKSIIRSAEEEAKGERELTTEELKKRSSDLIEMVSQRIVSSVFDSETVRSNTQQTIEKLPEVTACNISDEEVNLCDAIRSSGDVRHVVVETAIGLDEMQKERVENFIHEFTASRPSIEFIVNDSIISGLRMNLDDTLFDASVARMIKHTVSENLR